MRHQPRRSQSAMKEALDGLFDSAGALKLGRRHRPDYLLVVLILALALIGTVVLFSIIPAITGGDEASTANYLLRQGFILVAGVAAFFIASAVPLDFWRRHGTKLFVAGLFLCFILPIMGWLGGVWPAIETGGAWRRFSILGVGFQPAEFLKLGLVFFTSGFLAVRAARGELNDRKTLVQLGVIALAALFIIVIMQKDLGTGVSLVAIILAQMIVAGMKLRYLLLAVTALAATAVVSIMLAPHRMQRILTFFGQGNEVIDYQSNQAMIALGSGGLTGRGLGQSVQAFGWLPEAEHDTIFAILGETLGYVGLVVILIIFAILLKRIIGKSDFIENMYLRLVVAGVFGWLAAHVIMNIGGMIHVLPLTGITLPLVSLGGTSMLFIMTSLGVVFAISRYTTHRKIKLEEEKGDQRANLVRRRWLRRPHYAHRGDR